MTVHVVAFYKIQLLPFSRDKYALDQTVFINFSNQINQSKQFESTFECSTQVLFSWFGYFKHHVRYRLDGIDNKVADWWRNNMQLYRPYWNYSLQHALTSVKATYIYSRYCFTSWIMCCVCIAGCCLRAVARSHVLLILVTRVCLRLMRYSHCSRKKRILSSVFCIQVLRADRQWESTHSIGGSASQATTIAVNWVTQDVNALFYSHWCLQKCQSGHITWQHFRPPLHCANITTYTLMYTGDRK